MTEQQTFALLLGEAAMAVWGDMPRDIQEALFETAMREARRVANESSDTLSPSAQPSIWSTSPLPGDERDK